MQDADTAQGFDIAVVGAGMVGAALALGLGRQGWRVALVEQKEPTAPEADAPPDLRVSAINARSESLLRDLGAWDGIESHRYAPFRRLTVWEESATPRLRGRPLNEVCFDAHDLGRSHFGQIVENLVTQYALWAAIQGEPAVQTFCPEAVASLTQEARVVRLGLDSGLELTAGLVIGADGAASRVRTLAHMGIYRDQYDQQALVATVRHAGPAQNTTWQAFYPSGPRAYLPLPDISGESWASLVWYDSPERIAELKRLPDSEFLACLQKEFPERLPRLLAVPARGSFPIAKMQAQAYYRQRVALVGDAAHTINPLAGLGVNLGFQDVECLLDLLEPLSARPGADPSRVLARYQSRRRPAAQQMIWLMDLFYYTFSNQRLPLQLARSLGLFAAERLPLGKDLVARYAMGITPLPRSLAPRDLLGTLPRPPGSQLLSRLRPGRQGSGLLR